MSKQKKGGIINNFRLTLVNDDTHDKLWSRKFTRMGALVTAITTVVVTITVIFCLIAFTPIRTLIPGYPDARTKHDAIQNAIRVDSLQNVIMKWELYSENLRRVVDGQEPLKIDSLMEVRKNVTETVDPKKLAEKGGALIGVNTFTLDGDEAAISEAKDVLAKKGATYQNVYFDSDGEAGKFTTNIFAYPTTYVVDRSGNIVGEPIVGAITEKKQAETLQKLIDQALAADMG